MYKKSLIFIAVLATTILFGATLGSKNTYAAGCTFTDPKYELLGIPPWYKYLQGEMTESPTGSGDPAVCQPKITKQSDERFPKKDLLLIGAAVLEMLLRASGLAAFAFLVYGGFMYITSSGNSESTKKAGSTLLNAAIGLAIAISSTTLVNFFAKKLSAG